MSDAKSFFVVWCVLTLIVFLFACMLAKDKQRKP